MQSGRVLEPEIMDDPDLDRHRHRAALRGLARINRFSRSAAVLWPHLASLARATDGPPLRVLDVATGSGDIPVALGRRARRAGLALELHACDTSRRALAAARQRARQARVALRLFTRDVIADPPDGPYDVVLCSLFLHHLTDRDARTLLERLAAISTRLLLVHDLRRSTAGLLVARVFTRCISRSSVVHVDGPRSVRAAFTMPEARALARDAGLDGAVVSPRWPWRFLLEYRRPC